METCYLHDKRRDNIYHNFNATCDQYKNHHSLQRHYSYPKLINRKVRSTTTNFIPIREPLSRQNLIIMVSKRQPKRPPRIVMLAHRDLPAHALLRADGPVLLERARALDRRLVHARAGVQVVRALLEGEVPAERPGLARREDVVGVDDVVFDERVARPAVER